LALLGQESNAIEAVLQLDGTSPSLKGKSCFDDAEIIASRPKRSQIRPLALKIEQMGV
jgi:hypothetical protein